MKLEGILREVLDIEDDGSGYIEKAADALRKRRAEVATSLYELPTMKERMDENVLRSSDNGDHSSNSSHDLPESVRSNLESDDESDPNQLGLFSND